MIQLADVTKFLPIKIGIAGKRRDMFLLLFEKIFPLKRKQLYKLNNLQVTIDPQNINERLIYYFFYNVLQSYKNSSLYDYICSCFSKYTDNIFIDIGANLGFYSYFAKKLGVFTIAFEPENHHFKFLKRNSMFCDKVYKIALSDKKGNCDFYIANEFNQGGEFISHQQ